MVECYGQYYTSPGLKASYPPARRGEVVKPAEEQRIDLGLPTPLVNVLCPGFTFLWFCMGYTEEAPDTGVTSPAPKTYQCNLKKKNNPHECFSFFSYLDHFPRFLLLDCCPQLTHYTLKEIRDFFPVIRGLQAVEPSLKQKQAKTVLLLDCHQIWKLVALSPKLCHTTLPRKSTLEDDGALVTHLKWLSSSREL